MQDCKCQWEGFQVNLLAVASLLENANQLAVLVCATDYMQVANTIRKQIAFNKLVSMIGAYNPMGENKGLGSLSFRFKAKAAKLKGKSPNWVRVTLTPDDSYTIEFGRVQGLNFTILEKLDDIYVDNLLHAIKTKLQLDLSL